MLFAALISGCVIDLTEHDGTIWDDDGYGTDSGWSGWGYPDAPESVGSFTVRSLVWMNGESVGVNADGEFGGVNLGSSVCHFESRSGVIDSDIATSGATIDIGGLNDAGSVAVGQAGGEAWAVTNAGASSFEVGDVRDTAVEGDTVAILGGSRCAVHIASIDGGVRDRIPQPEAACERGRLALVGGHAYTVDGTAILVDGLPTAVATAALLFDVDVLSDTAFVVEGQVVRAARLSTGETLWTVDAGGTVRSIGVGGAPAYLHVLVDRGVRWFGAWDLDGVEVTGADLPGIDYGSGWPMAVARDAGTVVVGTGEYTLVMNR